MSVPRIVNRPSWKKDTHKKKKTWRLQSEGRQNSSSIFQQQQLLQILPQIPWHPFSKKHNLIPLQPDPCLVLSLNPLESFSLSQSALTSRYNLADSLRMKNQAPWVAEDATAVEIFPVYSSQALPTSCWHIGVSPCWHMAFPCSCESLKLNEGFWKGNRSPGNLSTAQTHHTPAAHTTAILNNWVVREAGEVASNVQHWLHLCLAFPTRGLWVADLILQVVK